MADHIRAGEGLPGQALHRLRGRPRGGYVFFEEALPTLEPGWYRWRRIWFEPPSHTPLEPREDAVYRYFDRGSEGLRVVDRYTYELREDEMYMADTLAP